MLKVLVSGGGTGGHIYPALAIAEAIKKVRPDATFLFVGALGKMEMQKVPLAGYEIVGLPVQGFHRKFDKRNLQFPLKLFRSFLKARKVVRDFKPDVAVGTGGFASGPALFAAHRAGVPVFIQEQNAYPGVTNRMLSKFAKEVFLAYEKSKPFFAGAKTSLTGNPLRSDLSRSELPSKTQAVQAFNLQAEKPVLLSFGGSLGARKLNEAHAQMYDFWKAHPEIQLIWQTGEGYYQEFSVCQTAALPNVCCLPYLNNMSQAYGAADLVACRAGALSISELQLLGKPAFLIPSPNVAGDHQTANAKAVERNGAARCILDAEIVTRLRAGLKELLLNQEKLDEMSAASLRLAKPNAATEIANKILTHVAQ